MPTRPKKQHTYKQPEPQGFLAPDYRSRPEYHTARWQRLRKRFLEQPQHIYCVRCKAQNRYSLAKVVDHIIPAELCEDFWDESNLQPLCERCNRIKGAEDRKMIQEHRRGVGGQNLYGQTLQDQSPAFEDTQPKFSNFPKTDKNG